MRIANKGTYAVMEGDDDGMQPPNYLLFLASFLISFVAGEYHL